ncbi:MAG: hypothetical protein ACK4N5_05935 [Myxococcales bacterium]
MVSQIIDLILAEVAAAGGGTHKKLIGQKHLAEQGKPPKLVWIPKAMRFGAPVKAAANPRPLRTRYTTVELVVHGATLDATEALLHRILAAAHAVTHGSYELGDGEWDVADAQLQHGVRCAVDLVFAIPVTEVPKATVEILATAQISELQLASE